MVSLNRRPAEVIWNYDPVELIADGIVHAIGVSLGLAGAIAIVVVAANSPHTAEISSVAVYSVGLLSMLGFSAAYNTWPVSHAKSVLRRFDHSAIFVMIAGTYTPFIAQMKGDLVAMGLLIGVWLTAVVGIILKLLWPGRFDRLAVVLYLLLGWSGAVVYEPAVAALPSSSIWLLAVGGALYSTGVVFYAWRSLRFQNVIWHAFVLAAACCHFSAVLFCIARSSVKSS
jgi:hemolysin III